MKKREKQRMIVGFRIQHVPCILSPIYVAWSQSGKESATQPHPYQQLPFTGGPYPAKGKC
jgi:hypothetical protein